MKRIAIFAAAALFAAAAHADPVTVTAPKAGASSEEVASYVAKLDKAVREVCYEAASPVVGIGYYSYLACLKETRAAVGKKDPTGLYAQYDSTAATEIAAK